HARTELGDGHIRLALQDQTHPHAAPRRIADLPQHPIAGEKVGIGDYQARARIAYGLQIMLLDVVAMVVVVTGDEKRPRLATADTGMAIAGRLAPAFPPAPPRLGRGDIGEGETVNVVNHRPFYLQCVVLLGLGAKTPEVICREVDPADKGQLAIHHHQLAVHPTENIDAFAEQTLTRIEHVDAYAGLDHGSGKIATQISRSVAIDGDVYADTALGRTDQNFLQAGANLVLIKDERFQQDFFFRCCNGVEDRWEKLFAIFQQLKTIPVSPVKIHNLISTARGR